MESYLNLTSRAVGQIPCWLKDSGTKHHTIRTLTGKKGRQINEAFHKKITKFSQKILTHQVT